MGRFINIFSEQDVLSMYVTGTPLERACHNCPAFVLLLDGGLEVMDAHLSSGQLAFCVENQNIRYFHGRKSKGIVVNVSSEFIHCADSRFDVPEEFRIRTLGENDFAILKKYFDIFMDERQGRDLDDSTVSLIKALLVRLARILGYS